MRHKLTSLSFVALAFGITLGVFPWAGTQAPSLAQDKDPVEMTFDELTAYYEQLKKEEANLLKKQQEGEEFDSHRLLTLGRQLTWLKELIQRKKAKIAKEGGWNYLPVFPGKKRSQGTQRRIRRILLQYKATWSYTDALEWRSDLNTTIRALIDHSYVELRLSASTEEQAKLRKQLRSREGQELKQKELDALERYRKIRDKRRLHKEKLAEARGQGTKNREPEEKDKKNKGLAHWVIIKLSRELTDKIDPEYAKALTAYEEARDAESRFRQKAFEELAESVLARSSDGLKVYHSLGDKEFRELLSREEIAIYQREHVKRVAAMRRR